MLDAPNKRPKPKPLPRGWRNAFERLDRALNENCPLDYADRIEIFGRMHFGDLWIPRSLRKDSDDDKQ